MTDDNRLPRLVTARQFEIGVENDRVTIRLHYKDLPKDMSELQLGLSLPSDVATQMAQLILEQVAKLSS